MIVHTSSAHARASSEFRVDDADLVLVQVGHLVNMAALWCKDALYTHVSGVVCDGNSFSLQQAAPQSAQALGVAVPHAVPPVVPVPSAVLTAVSPVPPALLLAIPQCEPVPEPLPVPPAVPALFF